MLETCRTCLAEIRDTTYIKLNDNDVKPRSVRTELLACIPELDLNLAEGPVICRNCVNILQLAHSFKTRCLLTEKRIQSCIRTAKLNGKPVTLTKLFRFSRETNGGNDCSTINGSVVKDSDVVNSDPTVGEHFAVQSGRASLDIEADNDEHERIDDCVTSTENEDSNVVVSSEGSLVEGEDDGDFENIITTNIITASIGLTLQPLEFQNKILGWSSAATCTDILGEMSQDLVNTMDDDIVKEECDLSTFKTETDEALSFKEESSNNNEEERCDDCKTGTWEDVIEETRSITDHAEGNNLVDGECEFPELTREGENFVENLDNQTKECCVIVRRLSTDWNDSCGLYSDTNTSRDTNITKHNVSNVKKRRVNYENCSACPLRKDDITYPVSRDEISQKMSDINENSLTKEPFNEIKNKRCAVGMASSIKECFVNLQRLNLSDLVNKSSSNVKELRNLTSAKSLQTTNKKCESVRHNGSKNLSKHVQADSTKKSFCCKVCKYSTTVKTSLDYHMRIHTNQKPFQCKVCDYKSIHKQHLISHMRTHTGEKRFQCKVCDYKTVHKQNLISHMRTHTGEKPFQCKVCDYRAVHKQNLINHMRTHTGEKPFQCNVCNYRAIRKQNLMKHVRIHTGDKPFQCKVCDYRAFQKQNLIRHMRTHTGEKPFQCNVCDYRAIHKQNIMKHVRSHTGERPFCCNVCDCSFNRKGDLEKHTRTHTGEKPYRCNVCEFKTSVKGNLTKHMQKHC